MNNAPLISVLMPVYNAASYVEEACRSILAQAYTNLELIIVDDASTDDSICQVEQIKDSRIRILKNEYNMGLAASLNKSIRQASGQYLARMDADDICLPDRMMIQLQAMEKNPHISLLGTGLQYFNASKYKNFFPEGHAMCKAKLLFNVCFGHSSLMFRRAVFENDSNLYNSSLRQYSEDYDLYSRLVDQFQFGNLKNLLVRYRTFNKSVKDEAESKRKANSRMVRNRLLLAMGIPENKLNMAVHAKASDLLRLESKSEYLEIGEWFEFLADSNKRTNYFDQSSLDVQLASQLFEIAYHNPHLRLRLSQLEDYSFFNKQDVSLRLKAKFLIKKGIALL